MVFWTATNMDKMASRAAKEAVREEWKIVARLMDRIFGIIGIIPFV